MILPIFCELALNCSGTGFSSSSSAVHLSASLMKWALISWAWYLGAAEHCDEWPKQKHGVQPNSLFKSKLKNPGLHLKYFNIILDVWHRTPSSLKLNKTYTMKAILTEYLNILFCIYMYGKPLTTKQLLAKHHKNLLKYFVWDGNRTRDLKAAVVYSKQKFREKDVMSPQR